MSGAGSAVFVAGLVNIETTLRVDGFPVDYAAVRYPFFGVENTVSGVGYNVAKALTVLGRDVRFATLVGADLGGRMAREALAEAGISTRFVVEGADRTAESVILYEASGRRQINLDLKDIQERDYPVEPFEEAMRGCSLAVLCNINFSRPLLSRARRAGALIATDVHTLSSIEDEYNRDFLEHADILFLSDEHLWDAPERAARALLERYRVEVVVIGLGARGAVLGRRGSTEPVFVPSVATRPVVSTIGAGDALFSCFVDEYARHGNPLDALRRAVVFASWKIGAASASEGFLRPEELERLATAPGRYSSPSSSRSL